MLFDYILGRFSNDLAIDLGTANTLVYVKGKGIVLDEPSVVAVHQDARGVKKVLAVGAEAKIMLGRTPGNITAIRPLRDGVIADFDVTEAMLKHFILKVHNRKALVHPRIIVAVPSGITQVEKRAVRETAIQAGAREIYLIEEPMAAAIGAGLKVTSPSGSFIVDIGGGTCEAALISLGGIVNGKSLKTAGESMDQNIVDYTKKKKNLIIGQQSAERSKIEAGSATINIKNKEKLETALSGRETISGLPRAVKISDAEIAEAVRPSLMEILGAIKDILEDAPPELVADVQKDGIIFAGGGSLLRNIIDFFSGGRRLK